jgi:hypothetical protein
VDPPWTEDSTYISAQTKRAWQEERRSLEEEARAERRRQRREKEAEEDTPHIEWTQKFKPEPGRWRVRADTDDEYLQRIFELEYGRWREEAEERMEPVRVLLRGARYDERRIHGKVVRRIESEW